MHRTHLSTILIACFLIVPDIAFAACDLNATPANFASQLAAAQPGQTLCLATGDYGKFNGVTKTSPGVTITAEQGATPTLSIQFRQTSPVPAWLILDSLTITGGEITAPAHDITVQNSTITDKLNFWQNAANSACGNCPAMNNQNIVFDNDVFNMAANQNGTGGYEGRVNLVNAGSNDPSPAGVTIKNSIFTTGCADGVQVCDGGRGVTIGPGNEFVSLQQGSCGPHVDSIQFVGSDNPGPTITGNYFHDNSDGIVAYDYENYATINNNVVVNVTHDALIMGGVDNNTIIEHNTTPGQDIACSSNHEVQAPCTAIIRDNISTGYNGGGAPAGFQPSFFDYNLCTAGSCAFNGFGPGAHSLIGTPTYVGGSNPNTYAGFALTAGSLGHNAGSDGKDMGINITNNDPPPPDPPTGLRAEVQ